MSRESDINSCKMTAKWDWATGPASGQITDGQEVYRLNDRRLANAGGAEVDYPFEVIETKNKVRGNGKTLVLRFESTTGKDFEILGWAMDVTGETQ